MTPKFYQRLPEDLKRLADKIEAYCGLDIVVVTKPGTTRGRLSFGPARMRIEVSTLPTNRQTLAVLCHELCHAERYFPLKIPFMQFTAPRKIINSEGVSCDAAENLDNMLEHIIVIREMKERFGINTDSAHVVNDLSRFPTYIDPFSRRCLLLANSALIHFHFPELRPTVDELLLLENLVEVNRSYLNELESSLNSKPRMVAALVDALQVDRSEVRLRIRDVVQKCDAECSLQEALDDEGGGHDAAGTVSSVQ